MTAPTIGYGHGYLDDLTAALTNKVDSGDPLTGPACACLLNDFLDIYGTCDNAADEYVAYRTADLTSLSILTSLYPYFMVRWKTSASSNGLGAKIVIEYTDASTDTPLGLAAPQFGTNFKVTTSAALTAGKTVKYIWFYADDYPNTVNAGTFHVYYDFALFRSSLYTFPYPPFTTSLRMGTEEPDLLPPGRMGGITQDLGEPSPEITLEGTMDSNAAWYMSGTEALVGEILYRLDRDKHLAYHDWFWLTTDLGNFKVRPQQIEIWEPRDTIRNYRVPFRVVCTSNLAEQIHGGSSNISWTGKES